jgi:hypothetical protein
VLEIIDCEQNSEQWFKARLGILTASNFHKVLGKEQGGGDPKMRRALMLDLIGERMTGEQAEHYSNKHTERGHDMEDAARALYQFITDDEVQRIGFVKNLTAKGNQIGFSPDSFIGADGVLEIKTKLPRLHFEVVLSNKLPPEHYAQCQGGLWTAEREWIAFMSYWPKLDPFILKVYRDENYIRWLASEVDIFCEDMARVEGILRSGKIDGPVSTYTRKDNPIQVPKW